MSIVKDVTSATHGVTAITGVMTFRVNTEDSSIPVHIDGDGYNTYADLNLGGITVEIDSTDITQVFAFDGVAVGDLVIVCNECGASTSTTFTLENALPHSPKINTPEPGGISTATISFAILGDTGAADGIAIASA